MSTIVSPKGNAGNLADAHAKELHDGLQMSFSTAIRAFRLLQKFRLSRQRTTQLLVGRQTGS